jgi:HAD superfamily hydrolase (TIGR01509 family)
LSRSLIFDCDGVLADTELHGHLPAFNATFAAFGLPLRWDEVRYRSLVRIGGGIERMRTIFDDDDLVRAAGLPNDHPTQEMLLQAWHLHKTALFVAAVESGEIPPRSGVRRIAQAAADAGWRLAVASTSAQRSVLEVLSRAVGPVLAKQFSPVLAGDVVPHKKPAPDIYLAAMRELGQPREDILVIEDSGVGSMAAYRAGLPVVITVSPLTVDDRFAPSPLVVTELGDFGGAGTKVIASQVGPLSEDVVTLTDLDRCFGWKPAP